MKSTKKSILPIFLVDCPLRPRPQRNAHRKTTTAALCNDSFLSSRPFTGHELVLHAFHVTAHCSPSLSSTLFQYLLFLYNTPCTPRTINRSPCTTTAFTIPRLLIGELFIRSPTSHSCGLFRSGLFCVYAQRQGVRNNYAKAPPTSFPFCTCFSMWINSPYPPSLSPPTTRTPPAAGLFLPCHSGFYPWLLGSD